LAVEECVTLEPTIAAMNLPCFGGFRIAADDLPKPWRLRTEGLQRPGAQVGMFFGDHGVARGAPYKEVWNVFFIDHQGRAYHDPDHYRIDHRTRHHFGEILDTLEDSAQHLPVCPADFPPSAKRTVPEGLRAL